MSSTMSSATWRASPIPCNWSRRRPLSAATCSRRALNPLSQQPQRVLRTKVKTSRCVEVGGDEVPSPVCTRLVPPGRRFGMKDPLEDTGELVSIDPGERDDKVGYPTEGLGDIGHSVAPDEDSRITQCQVVGDTFVIEQASVSMERQKVAFALSVDCDLALKVVSSHGGSHGRQPKTDPLFRWSRRPQNPRRRGYRTR